MLQFLVSYGPTQVLQEELDCEQKREIEVLSLPAREQRVRASKVMKDRVSATGSQIITQLVLVYRVRVLGRCTSKDL